MVLCDANIFISAFNGRQNAIELIESCRLSHTDGKSITNYGK